MRNQGRLITAFAVASALSFSLEPGWSQTGGTPSSSGSAAPRKPSAPGAGPSKAKAGDATNYGRTISGGSSVPQSTADCPDGAYPSGLRQSPSPGSSAANKGAASSPSTAGSSARSNTASDRSLSNVNCLPSGGTSGSETGASKNSVSEPGSNSTGSTRGRGNNGNSSATNSGESSNGNRR